MRSRNRRFNESYSDINSSNAWDAYDVAMEYMGAEYLCEALAKAMGTDELAENLEYIFRVYEIPFDDDEKLDEGVDYPDFSRAANFYGLTPSELQLYKTAEENLDTEKGYEAYFALTRSIDSRKGDDTVLYDLAADFAWDDRLSKAAERYLGNSSSDDEFDESVSRKYSRKIKESLNDIIEGKYGEYHIDAPSGNIESWTVWFIPYENRSAPIHDRWDSGTFIPDGSERIQYRCQRRIDAERIIDRWERKV